jgi:hypothetical protein
MAKFELTPEIVYEITVELSLKGKYVITLPVTFVDKAGIVYATATKELYIATKSYYKKRTVA